MKSLVIAAVFAAAALTNVASADPLICNEPWYTPQPHPPHPMPCHARESQVHTSNGHGRGQPPGRPGSEAAPSATDGGCSLTAVSDTSLESPADSMIGFLYGGTITQTGTLTCTIKLNVSTHGGAYVNGASRSGTGTNGTTVLSPGVVSYIAPPGEPAYVCDQFNDGTTTWVLDARTDTWVPAGTAGAECYIVLNAGTHDPILDPIYDLLDTMGALVSSVSKDLLDPVFCPALSLLQGDYAGVATINSQGDVFRLGEPFWDCPPYDLS
ncbi:MAG TPA: hypothetical protein VNQ77_02110 [Frankiaceae bacterium]|nr:hypothetical protein [Frankiaceae bacterium]